eukprot:608357-Amphidinium_carterae.1
MDSALRLNSCCVQGRGVRDSAAEGQTKPQRGFGIGSPQNLALKLKLFPCGDHFAEVMGLMGSIAAVSVGIALL